VFGTAHQTLWELQVPSISEAAAPGCILRGNITYLSPGSGTVTRIDW